MQLCVGLFWFDCRSEILRLYSFRSACLRCLQMLSFIILFWSLLVGLPSRRCQSFIFLIYFWYVPKPSHPLRIYKRNDAYSFHYVLDFMVHCYSAFSIVSSFWFQNSPCIFLLINLKNSPFLLVNHIVSSAYVSVF